MRNLPFLLLAAGMFAGCGGATTDTEDTGSGKDTDTGGGDTQDTQDTQETGGPDTGYSAVYLFGDYEVAQGKLQAGSFGYEFTDPSFSAAACDVVGAVDAATVAPGSCADCEWSYTFTTASASPVGDGCGSVDTSWVSFSGTQGMGWAAQYTFYGPYYTYEDSNVIFRYFSGYGWYEYVYNNDVYGSAGYVSGDGATGEFYKILGYVYYYY